MVKLRLEEGDHRRVSEAIAAAESASDGEILTIVAADSDSYHVAGRSAGVDRKDRP